ncbi:hypothetical protein HETIRDRAFT_452942 [Heterobasidion irregulare TC 32-1]|uniref:Uncharacterized protein n=1 Tax=Heterobasidion irregulare (strain TC 32-1) TaxID=747525 RepID=W4K239_HETIT|nr:uncharacterized protein HETIRDRAFT_452942 [Heterobasidion irregulare TC 32-1]ETW79883.1 hypothetical protein HETIRDRAFT_452942 [Heterobasidion irregulare TC 32-1]
MRASPPTQSQSPVPPASWADTPLLPTLPSLLSSSPAVRPPSNSNSALPLRHPTTAPDPAPRPQIHLPGPVGPPDPVPGPPLAHPLPSNHAPRLSPARAISPPPCPPPSLSPPIVARTLPVHPPPRAEPAAPASAPHHPRPTAPPYPDRLFHIRAPSVPSDHPRVRPTRHPLQTKPPSHPALPHRASSKPVKHHCQPDVARPPRPSPSPSPSPSLRTRPPSSPFFSAASQIAREITLRPRSTYPAHANPTPFSVPSRWRQPSSNLEPRLGRSGSERILARSQPNPTRPNPTHRRPRSLACVPSVAPHDQPRSTAPAFHDHVAARHVASLHRCTVAPHRRAASTSRRRRTSPVSSSLLPSFLSSLLSFFLSFILPSPCSGSLPTSRLLPSLANASQMRPTDPDPGGSPTRASLRFPIRTTFSLPCSLSLETAPCMLLRTRSFVLVRIMLRPHSGTAPRLACIIASDLYGVERAAPQ